MRTAQAQFTMNLDLLAAAKANNLAAALQAIDNGADVTAQTPESDLNAAHYFAQHRNIEAMEALAQRDASILLAADDRGYYPTTWLAKKRDIDGVLAMATIEPAVLTITNAMNYGRTIAHAFAVQDDTEALITLAVLNPELLTIQNACGYTPVDIFCYRGNNAGVVALSRVCPKAITMHSAQQPDGCNNVTTNLAINNRVAELISIGEACPEVKQQRSILGTMMAELAQTRFGGMRYSIAMLEEAGFAKP